MKTFVFFPLLAAILLLPPAAAAQKKKADPKKVEPRVTLAIPLGSVPGTTTRITIRGLNLHQVKEVKFAEPGVLVKILSQGKANVPDKNPDKVGDTQVVVDVTLAPEQKTSVSFVVVTALGDTKPHSLLIDTSAPLVKEKEPNDGFRQAQPLQLPQIVEGMIDRPKDVDVFRFDGKAGQRVSLTLLAARHGSALDGILTLYDANGQQVASCDGAGKHGDPQMEVTLPRAGTYYLSLIDAHDQGGPTHVYRIVLRPLP